MNGNFFVMLLLAQMGGYEKSDVAVRVTKAEAHLVKQGVLLKEFPNAVAGRHPKREKKKQASLVLDNKKLQETAITLTDGKIETKLMVDKINKQIYPESIPADLTSSQTFEKLVETAKRVETSKKTENWFFYKSTPAAAPSPAPSKDPAQPDGLKVPPTILESYLIQIAPRSETSATPPSAKEIYDLHYVRVPITIAIHREELGRPDSKFRDFDGLQVVRHTLQKSGLILSDSEAPISKKDEKSEKKSIEERPKEIKSRPTPITVYKIELGSDEQTHVVIDASEFLKTVASGMECLDDDSSPCKKMKIGGVEKQVIEGDIKKSDKPNDTASIQFYIGNDENVTSTYRVEIRGTSEN